MHYGAAEGAVHVTGLLSEAPMALPCDPDELDRAAAAVGSRDIWFATQVPMSELDLVIAAHEKLRAANRRLLLILNTQQIESEETLAIDLAAKGWRVGVRTKGNEITDNTQIFLSSGIEELGLWYRLSPVSLVGGTFSNDVSSADPMQAAALGSAILHGPRTSPFREAFDQLHAQTPAAATQVVNPSSLARHVETHHPGRKADRLIYLVGMPYRQGSVGNTIESGAVRQHRRHIHFGFRQDGGHSVGANGVNHLKRAALPVEAKLHRIIDVLR